MKTLQRIYIIGTMGSGKTTLAKKLSGKLKIKHYDLDDIYWTKKFTHKRSDGMRLKLLKRLVAKDKWIIEGVFTKWTDAAMKNCDLVVWLDLNPHYVVRNITKRFIIGKIKGDERGNFKDQWASVKYAIRYRKDTNKFKGHKGMIEKYNPNLVHIKTRGQLNKFLRGLK